MYSDEKKRIINRVSSLALALIFLFVVFCNVSWAASKRSEVRKGNDYYSKGNYDQSIEKYKEALKKDLESDIINFNLGTALYKKGEYKEAQTHLAKTLLSDDKVLKQKAFYNLGNSFYKSGIAQEDKNIDQAITDITESVKHLESAVGLNTDDQEAKNNTKFVQKELERLKKKKEEQKDSKFCPNPKKEDGSKDQKSEEKKSDQSKSEEQKSQGQKTEQSNSANQQSKNQPQPKLSSAEEKKETQSQDQPAETKSAEEQKKDEKDLKEQSAQNVQISQPAGEGKNAQQSLEVKDAGKLTDKESQILLENYEQNEAPKGMYQMKLQRRKQAPVGKDW